MQTGKHSYAKGLRLPAVGLLILGLALSACSVDGTAPEPGEEPGADVQLDPTLVAAAEAAALEATGGEQIGGDLVVMGTIGGVEGEVLKAVFQPFADATGINLDYQSTTDIRAVVQTQLRAGNPPDIVMESSMGIVAEYVAADALLPLNDIIDLPKMIDEYGQGAIDAHSLNGNLYGIPGAAHNLQIWYNPKQYEGPIEGATFDALLEWGKSEVAAGNPSPICMTLSQGAVTGAQGVLMVENMFLKEYGPDKLRALGDGSLAKNSPEVVSTFEDFLTLYSEGLVYGGEAFALSTPMVQSPTGMFTDPQQCQLVHWGSFTPGIIQSQDATLVAGEDFDFFQLASETEEFNDVLDSYGWVSIAFNDTPQVQAFLRWYSSVEFNSLIASTGNWVMANGAVPAEVYPSVVQQKLAQKLAESELAFGPYFMWGSELRAKWFDVLVNSLQDPAALKTELDELQAMS